MGVSLWTERMHACHVQSCVIVILLIIIITITTSIIIIMGRVYAAASAHPAPFALNRL